MLGAWLRLARVEHSLMLILGVLTVVVIEGKPLLLNPLLYVVPPVVSAAAFILNDFMDIETDRINNKRGPLVTGEIKPQTALIVSALLFVLGLVLAYPLGPLPFITVTVFTILSIAYNWKLKDVALVGNIVIALSMAIVFAFTDLYLTGTLTPPIVGMMAVSFLSGLGRELQKTTQDMEGDRKARRSRTLPMIIGKNNTLYLAAILITAASAGALYLFLDVPPMMGNLSYLGLALLSIGLFAYATFLFFGDKRSMEKGRKISLYALVIGLLSFLVAGI